MQSLTWSDVIDSFRKAELEAELEAARKAGRTPKPKSSQVECCLRRHFLRHEPGFPQIGARATKAQLTEIEIWYKVTPFPSYTEKEWRTKIEERLEQSGLKNGQKRHARSSLLQVLEYAKDGNFVLPEPSDNIASSTSTSLKPLHRQSPPLVIDLRGWQESKPKRKSSPKIIFSFDSQDYLEEYRRKYPDLTDEQRLELINRELLRIKKSWDDAVIWGLNQGITQNSLDSMYSSIFRLLGYCYQKNQDLENTSLEALVPVVSTEIDFDDCNDRDDYYLKQGKAASDAKKAAKKTIKFLNHFIQDYSPHVRRGTKIRYADSLIFFAKYRHKDITDILLSKQYDDIPTITALNAYKRQLPKDPPCDKTLPLTLSQTREVLETQKIYADDPYNYSTVRKPGKEPKIKRTKRKLRGNAIDHQKLVILSFLCAIPPLRARTLAELRIGETLKYGLFCDGLFTPHDRMKDPSKALYYFDMKDTDYKTGKTYGDYCTVIPNYKFKDGSSFYDYLNSWINTWRQHLLKHGQNHNYLFVYLQDGKEKNIEDDIATCQCYLAGDPMSANGFESMCAQIMKRFTGAEIRPHMFRSIYRTHFATIGASKQVMDALAHFMQHSSPVADGFYDRRTSAQRCQPLLDFLN